MSFDQPLALILLALPLGWFAWEWRAGAARGALLLKALALAAIAVALAQPRLVVYRTKVAACLLADASDSVSARDLGDESALAEGVERARGSNWLRVIPFARATRDAAPEEHGKKKWELRHSAGAAARGTDLEAAIRDGAASLPPGMIPRLLLVSDGNENLGVVERGIWQARQLEIPVDTALLAGRPMPGLSLDSVTLPAQVFSGERFPIEMNVESERSASAEVELAAEGKTIGASRVELAPGPNRLRLEASVNSAGAIGLAARVAAEGLGEARFEDAITLRRPRALLISHDQEGGEEHLRQTLEANQFEVVRSADGVPEKLSDYQLVVVNNWDIRSIPPARQAALEQFVRLGGGLLWIGGERNVYFDQKGEEDPLTRALPAKLLPPRNPEGTAVVLVVDKSSSMEGKKIELARLAAIGVVENLRPIDYVGVLVFDNTFEWAAPLRLANDRQAIERLISGITPDGGTQIGPALAEAYARILPINAAYKHIVLLTDGISEEGDTMALTDRARENHVTISTIGLGQDVNRSFLERVANQAGGKAYFLSDPTGLERIVLRDVEEHTGSTAVEKSFKPKVAKRAAVLDGVGIEDAPALLGYVRFRAREESDTILETERGDPLLVRWQYGLGRATVFTSDAKNRWAVNWVAWPGFDRLWANIVRDLLPHAPPAETTVELDHATNELVVDYRLSRELTTQVTEGEASPPGIYVFGPNGFRAPLRLSKLANGHYLGRVAIGQKQGLFRIRPVEESRAFPEVGFYRQEEELREFGNNEALLKQIAASTGGVFNPSPRQVFDPRGRSVRSTMSLWPGLLAMAVLLNLAELFLRKGRGVLDLFRRRRAAEAAQ